MNPIAKHYMRLRFQKRVNALKKAGIAVNQKNVYDEDIQVGVPVPQSGGNKTDTRQQSDYAENKLLFAIEFIATGILATLKAIINPRPHNVFKDHSDLLDE